MPKPRSIIKKFPQKPGVYFFKNAAGKIIYIGKASDLRSRVASYWRKGAGLSPAKQKMLKGVKKIEVSVADSEIEALLLEANLIKKYQPQYNVVLRDDKSFVYIKVSTEEQWPRVFVTRQLEKSGQYFGPFTSAEAVYETLKTIRKFLPFRCNYKVNGNRACLYYHLGRCPGTCIGAVSQREYLKIIRQIIRFLQGKKNDIIRELKKEQRAARKTADENKAARIEAQLLKMEQVLAHSRILSLGEKYEMDFRELARVLKLPNPPSRIEGYDISNIIGQAATGAMVVFTNGEPDKSEYRKFKIRLEEKPNDVAMMGEMFTRRFARMQDKNKKTWPSPDLIVVDGGKGQLNTATRVLKKYKLDIPVISIAKREEEIYFPGQPKPLLLPKSSPALHLVMRIRDEAHRFAIGYHKLLRRRRVFGVR